MKYFSFWPLAAILAFHGAANAQSPEKKQGLIENKPNTPWLRVYKQYVRGIYFDVKNVQSNGQLNAAHVLVAISPKNKYETAHVRPQIRLVSYATNKIEKSVGCIFHPNDTSAAIDICGQLRLRAIKKYPQENLTCEMLRSTLFSTWMFLDEGLKPPRCLGQSTSEQYFQNLSTGEWLKQGVDLTPRHVERSRISPELVMGQNAYLGLESNRFFGCSSYGLPTTYRVRRVTETEAKSNQITYDDNFYQMPPAWQYQYLINTKGFKYYCHQGWRLIDEPEEHGAYLDDGTALLVANISILRIRIDDGGTEAATIKVKRIMPNLTRDAIEKAIGLDKIKNDESICTPGISRRCPLVTLGGGLIGKNINQSKHFIQGIDYVMQSFFINP